MLDKHLTHHLSTATRKGTLVLASILFLCLIPRCSVLKEYTGTLVVYVNNTNLSPILHAIVTLNPADNIPHWSRTDVESFGVESTGVDGKVIFRSLDPEKYWLDIRADGYRVTQRFCSIRSRDTTNLVVTLYRQKPYVLNSYPF